MHVLFGVGFLFVRRLKLLQLGLAIERFKIIIQVELGDRLISMRHILSLQRISLRKGFLLTIYMTRASVVDEWERILVNDQSICLL